jgi:hypothetical protein
VPALLGYQSGSRRQRAAGWRGTRAIGVVLEIGDQVYNSDGYLNSSFIHVS